MFNKKLREMKKNLTIAEVKSLASHVDWYIRKPNSTLFVDSLECAELYIVGSCAECVRFSVWLYGSDWKS